MHWIYGLIGWKSKLVVHYWDLSTRDPKNLALKNTAWLQCLFDISNSCGRFNAQSQKAFHTFKPSLQHSGILHVFFFIYETKNLGQYWKFLKIIRFSLLKVSYEFLKGSITFSMFTTCSLLHITKQSFLKPCQCLDFIQAPSK